jgi:hypothetical protein
MITKRTLKEARRLAREYDAIVKIVPKIQGNAWGYVILKDRKIILSSEKINNDPSILFGLIFHECGHLHCIDKGIWPAYHATTKINLKAFRLTAWKAELWIDRWAKKKLKQYNSSLKYKNGYDKSDKAWFLEELGT